MSIHRDTPIILSAGGKGGVGKSTIATALALYMARLGKRVGLLDLDIRAPNLPYILGVAGNGHTYDKEYHSVPVIYTDPLTGVQLNVFSSSMMFGDAKSILTEGMQLRSLVKDMLYDVAWPDMDVLVADLDPSTGDTLRAVTDLMTRVSAFAITSSDVSSIQDCRRMLDSFANLNVHTLGIVGNMLEGNCPDCHAPLSCGKCGAKVDYGHADVLHEVAKEFHTHVEGTIPWDPLFKSHPLDAIDTVGRAVMEHLAMVAVSHV